MKTAVALFFMVLAVFQLFFRYEHWSDEANPGAVYERDTLTGRVYRIEPGQKVDFVARLLGTYGEGKAMPKDEMPPEPVSMMTVDTTTKTQAAREKATRTEREAAARIIESFATRPIDLNMDGSPEEIIQSVTANDGLLDISVVQGGRELFYARGKQLHVMGGGRDGWPDLMLAGAGGAESWFRFEPGLSAYKRLERRP